MCRTFTGCFTVSVPCKVKKDEGSLVSKSARRSFAAGVTIDDVTQLRADDPNMLEVRDHNKQMETRTKDVNIYILSPVVNIIWLYLCAPWRDKLDFDFQRRDSWDDTTPVHRFNDTHYISMHNIYDWHDFVMLGNGTMLYETLIVRRPNGRMCIITDIDYRMKDVLANVTNVDVLKNHTNIDWWKPEIWMKYHNVKKTHNIYTICQQEHEYQLQTGVRMDVIPVESLDAPLFDWNGNIMILESPLQHPDVRNNKPFFFMTLGFDKYQHTTFGGKNDIQTHGVYWWISNMNPEFQFKKQLTMIMGQVTAEVPINTIGQVAYQHWQTLMQHGILIWNGTQLQRAFGMVSHQITDMEDRDHFMRRRGNNIKSRCDGMLWAGCFEGVVWPKNVHNLMQMHVITPGPYLLKLWKHLYKNPNWSNITDDVAMPVTLTTAKEDIYNELPLASSLKSTIEWNHTTVIGVLAKGLNMHWTQSHQAHNLKQTHTRILMKSYLEKYFHGINGMRAMLTKLTMKVNVYNSFNNTWQKMIEVLIAMPVCTNWFQNMDCLLALIRMTGAIFNVQSKARRQRLQNIMINVLDQS
jgi:hypothetical protein